VQFKLFLTGVSVSATFILSTGALSNACTDFGDNWTFKYIGFSSPESLS
jgi:hypothetical protein